MNRYFYIIPTAILLTAVSTINTLADEVMANAEVHFYGDSTLHKFKGKTPVNPFKITYTITPSNTVYLSASTSLNVIDMDTDNKKRDKNMYKMFEQKKYSTISASLENASLPLSGSTTAQLKINMHNIEKEIPCTLSDWQDLDGIVSCKMSFDVSLKSFGMKPPSVLGLIKVDDNVHVECIASATKPKQKVTK